MYGTQWVVNVSVVVKTVVHNVLSKMWGVCIMDSIWEEYWDRFQKGNMVFVRKGDHQVALGKEL